MDKMIVYEDKNIMVIHKPAGIATQTGRLGQADLVSELKNYRKKKGEDTYIGVVHRLDQPVEGLFMPLFFLQVVPLMILLYHNRLLL